MESMWNLWGRVKYRVLEGKHVWPMVDCCRLKAVWGCTYGSRWVIHLMVEDWSVGADKVSLWRGRWHTRGVLCVRHDRPCVYQAMHFIPHPLLLCCLGCEELKPFCC